MKGQRPKPGLRLPSGIKGNVDFTAVWKGEEAGCNLISGLNLARKKEEKKPV